MNYRKSMEKALDYIDKNIKEPLHLSEIAKAAGYSDYHFTRIFTIYMAMPPMQYVRLRKLASAAAILRKEGNILDVALQYSFETHSGFTKAFKKEFGLTPTQYGRLNATELLDHTRYKGGLIMAPKIIVLPQRQIAGYGIETNLSNVSFTRDIAAFWEKCEGENLEEKLYTILNPSKHGEFGLYIPSEKGKAIYMLGALAENKTAVPEEMFSIEIPEGLYAVFTTPAVDSTGNDSIFSNMIKKTWYAIFDQWFQVCGYIYDESRPEYEFYDERCHLPECVVGEIHIPIKKAL